MENTEFENMLMGLVPASGKIDPVAAAFEAGYRKGRQKARSWQVGTGCMAVLFVVAMLVAVGGNGKTEPQVVDQSHDGYYANAGYETAVGQRVDLETKDKFEPSRELNENSYILLRDKVLEYGLDALPKSTGGSSGRVYTMRDVWQG